MKICIACDAGNKEDAQICLNCSNPFPIEDKGKKKDGSKSRVRFSGSGSILAPAGPPPCTPRNLDNPTDDDLHDWIQKTIDKGIECNQDYAPQAVLYFSYRFWPYGSDVYKRLRAMLIF